MAMQDDRFVLPITKLEKAYEDEGVFVPRRGEGKAVASASLTLSATGKSKGSVAALKPSKAATKKLLGQAERTRSHVAGALVHAAMGDRWAVLDDQHAPAAHGILRAIEGYR